MPELPPKNRANSLTHSAKRIFPGDLAAAQSPLQCTPTNLRAGKRGERGPSSLGAKSKGPNTPRQLRAQCPVLQRMARARDKYLTNFATEARRLPSLSELNAPISIYAVAEV